MTMTDKLICITHRDTEEVHRIKRSLFSSELIDIGFTHTTKDKFRWFKNQVEKMKAKGSFGDYQKAMLLKY